MIVSCKGGKQRSSSSRVSVGCQTSVVVTARRHEEGVKFKSNWGSRSENAAVKLRNATF